MKNKKMKKNWKKKKPNWKKNEKKIDLLYDP